ncbi:MAG TPA: hypothetical protein DCZ55_18565 [Cyanobacteria bacterium UBA11371]|nr:hypothetical protein [Cyanobacteria bacterium UBA11371]HBE31288.1 hypothetical protein [Cyanobacteria bacterium UBA11368]
MNIKTFEPNVKRVIRWYSKYGDDFVGEKIINNVKLSYLQRLFKIDSDNPMYDCYPIVSLEQKNYIERNFNIRLNTNLYEYFMECEPI